MAKSKMFRMTAESLAAHQKKVGIARSAGWGEVATVQPTVAKSSLQKMQALGRLKQGEMNKTETAYAADLETRKHLGQVAWFKFEGMKFRLADNAHYTPDFAVMLTNGQLEMHEVKGHWNDDARVKIKVAAAMYPLRFIAVQKKLAKDSGGWILEEF